MEATPTTNTLPLRTENFSSLVEALDYAARGVTGYNFYSGSGKLTSVLSYAELRGSAMDLARRLAGIGLARGRRVALVADTHPEFIRFFFACQYAGLTPVPLPAQIQLGGRNAYVRQLQRLLAISRADLAMAPPEYLPYLTEAAVGSALRFLGGPGDYDHLPPADIPLTPIDAEGLAYIQYTSGSTRFPRGVMITQKAVMENLLAITRHGLCIRPDDRAVSWLPFYHDMGLVGLLLAPMACQRSVDYLGTRDFAMRPRLWLKLMSDNGGTVSFSPPFGYELVARRLRDTDLDGYNLKPWRVAGVGAEMISTEPLERFTDLLAPSGFDKRAFLPCYGMAECSLAVCFGSLNRGWRTDHVDADRLSEDNTAVPVDAAAAWGNRRMNAFVHCGTPLPGFEVEVRDPSGRNLPERRCGALYVRGPSVMTGYFGDPKATREALSPDGWLDTGDLAYRVGSEVVITGRKKDLIIINGRNIWPQDLEYLTELQPEIRTGDALAFSILGSDGREQAVVMIQCRESDTRGRDALKQRLHGLIRQELGIDCTIELVPRNTLTRTTSGKPSRHAARREYLLRIAYDPDEVPTEGSGFVAADLRHRHV